VTTGDGAPHTVGRGPTRLAPVLIGVMGLLMAPTLACEREPPAHDAAADRPAIPTHQTEWQPGMDGHWMRAPQPAIDDDADLDRLAALGYADGFQQAEQAVGVTVYDPDRALDGLNLYCSGHEPAAYLMDMAGHVVHRWALAYTDVPNPTPNPHRWFSGSWRRVRLLDDGSLLAIYENLGLVKLDRDSRIVWWFDGRAHHDLDLMPDGSIVVLTRERAFRRELEPPRTVIDDFVSFVSPDGVEQRRISILDALLRSDDFRHLVPRRRDRQPDLFHTNTVEVLDDRLAEHGPAFRPGNLLLSMRHLDTIAVLDPQTETVVWAARDGWRWQHEPTALANGDILLFDNLGGGTASRVLEIDPGTLATTWVYQGDPPESFFSVYCGTASRLSNGNTLITETCAGRAFEVTPSHDVVWRFVSPHRAGEGGELVAALFEVVRIPERPAWLDEGTE
jgi:hypothetical protein